MDNWPATARIVAIPHMGYTGTLQAWMQETFGWKLTIVKRPTRPRGVWAFPEQVMD